MKWTYGADGAARNVKERSKFGDRKGEEGANVAGAM